MAFNGTGVHNRVHNWTQDLANTIPVTASRMDAEHDDISSSLSSVICRDGQSSTTARIPFAQGTSAAGSSATAVAYSNQNDPNTGLYFPGSDQFGLAAGGASVLTGTGTGVTVTGTQSITGDQSVGGNAAFAGSVAAAGDITHHGQPIVPVGVVCDFAGTSAPNGWLLCYGQAVARSTYTALFAALGTTYGSGDGSTTFNLPDLRGRVLAGKDDMGGTSANRLTNQSGGLDGDVLGATGGAETHTLALAQLAAHSHAAGSLGADSAGTHQHDFDRSTGITSNTNGAAGTAYVADTNTTGSGSPVLPGGAHSHTVSGSTDTAGAGDPHNNVQPTIIFNKIIFASVYS